MKFLLPLLIPVAVAAFWCVICFFIAAVSGWRRLAQSFRASHTPQGQKFWMQRALINSARFDGVLNIIVGPEGLYLKMWPLFSVFGLGAPPLLIPWRELSPLHHERGRWFETWHTTITLGSSASVTITFFNHTAAYAISQFLPTIPDTSRVSL